MLTGGGGGASSTFSRSVLGLTLPPLPACAADEVAYRVVGCRKRWSGMTAIDASAAQNRLPVRVGTGQTVGLIDTGIDTGHPAWNGRTPVEIFRPGATDEDGSVDSHGTKMASIVAGDRYETPGLAPGANIVMWAVRTTDSSNAGTRNFTPYTIAQLPAVNTRWVGHVNAVFARPAVKFVNVSLGAYGLPELYSANDMAALNPLMTLMAQSGTANKTIFIRSAGNDHGQTCDPNNALFAANSGLCAGTVENGATVYRLNAKSAHIMASFPHYNAALKDAMLAVVALNDSNTGIASYSNRCGLAADWCVAAPGGNIPAAYFGPDPLDDTPGVRRFTQTGGTSGAAALVTGSLVAMKHYFGNQLSNVQLVARLKDTANDGGVFADSSIYGHGLIDLAAALQPAGRTRFASRTSVDGPGAPERLTRLIPGPAFGDALTRGFAGRSVMVLDELDGPFDRPLAAFTGVAVAAALPARLQAFMAAGPDAPAPTGLPGLYFSVADGAVNFDYAPDELPFSLSLHTSEGMAGAPATGARLSWAAAPGAELRLGLTAERKSMLGSTAQGAFGTLSAGAGSLGFGTSHKAGPWRLNAGAEIGMARGAGGGMLRKVSPIYTSTFALHAERDIGKGMLKLSAVQPMRVDSGAATLDIPVARTPEGRVLRQRFKAPLTPSGRQVDLSVRWTQPLLNGNLRLGAVWTVNPGHVSGAAAGAVMAGWRARF